LRGEEEPGISTRPYPIKVGVGQQKTAKKPQVKSLATMLLQMSIDGRTALIEEGCSSRSADRLYSQQVGEKPCKNAIYTKCVAVYRKEVTIYKKGLLEWDLITFIGEMLKMIVCFRRCVDSPAVTPALA
jgi:hypothetical protein